MDTQKPPLDLSTWIIRKFQFASEDKRILCINDLNDDILPRIFQYLHYDDKVRLRRTCSRWKRLLEKQLDSTTALRLGQFRRGGYSITSGLEARCSHSDPIPSTLEDNSTERYYLQQRQQTGTLFNSTLIEIPADLESQCYSIKRYDYLHRALKLSCPKVTMLSLGYLQISERLLLTLMNNLPLLEHLELINCEISYASWTAERRNQIRLLLVEKNKLFDHYRPFVDLDIVHEDDYRRTANGLDMIPDEHEEEEVNITNRMMRSNLIRSYEVIMTAKNNKLWPKLQHLLIQECTQLSEFMLCVFLSVTKRTLTHLELDRNYHLTGEFLNYCGKTLKVLKMRHCPNIKPTFVQELVKIRQILGATVDVVQGQSSSPLRLTSTTSDDLDNLTPRAVLFAILFNA